SDRFEVTLANQARFLNIKNFHGWTQFLFRKHQRYLPLLESACGTFLVHKPRTRHPQLQPPIAKRFQLPRATDRRTGARPEIQRQLLESAFDFVVGRTFHDKSGMALRRARARHNRQKKMADKSRAGSDSKGLLFREAAALKIGEAQQEEPRDSRQFL